MNRTAGERCIILYSSPNIIKIIKSRITTQMVDVGCIGQRKNTKFCLKNLKGRRDHVDDLGMDSERIFKCFLKLHSLALRFYTLMIVQIVVFCTVTLSGLVDVY
jgi:hypothetical protein